MRFVAEITTAGNGNEHGRMTIRDIASLAGVSPATVSRVINGRPEVSDAVREKVLRVVSEHGYTVSRPALAGMHSGLVGVTLPTHPPLVLLGDPRRYRGSLLRA